MATRQSEWEALADLWQERLDEYESNPSKANWAPADELRQCAVDVTHVLVSQGLRNAQALRAQVLKKGPTEEQLEAVRQLRAGFPDDTIWATRDAAISIVREHVQRHSGFTERARADFLDWLEVLRKGNPE